MLVCAEQENPGELREEKKGEMDEKGDVLCVWKMYVYWFNVSVGV